MLMMEDGILSKIEQEIGAQKNKLLEAYKAKESAETVIKECKSVIEALEFALKAEVDTE